MYRTQPYTGLELPSKCLCLTYDDGPGKDTCEIARFLSDQNIRATFFVVGKYAFHHRDILEKVAGLGHLIGNHTYEHPDMPYYLSVNGDIHNQILRTDSIIKKYVDGDTVYFRSPYGKWSAEVANELNLNILATVNHVGPIHWDIGGIDCLYWKNGETIDHTVEKYLEDIREKNHGIVVMHDEIADMDFLKPQNQTLALTKKLIPLLKEQGYTFVRLDEIESIRKDAVEPLKFRLKSTSGKLVSLSGNDHPSISVKGKKDSVLSELSIHELGHGQVALKASNGFYFSVQPNGNTIEAVSKEVNAQETFDLIPFSSYQVAFRAFNGNYLSTENKHSGKLLAAATYMRGCDRFTFLPTSTKENKKVTLKEKYQSLKRQLLYVKSKVQQNTQLHSAK